MFRFGGSRLAPSCWQASESCRESRPLAKRTRPVSVRPLLAFAITQILMANVTADLVMPSGDEILARIESENNRRHNLLKENSGLRQYTLQNPLFGEHAVVDVRMNYRQAEGERYTALTRSGPAKLNGIIDK